MPASRDPWRWGEPLVLLAAAALAVGGARPYAGGWNDGSRLAAVESLAERGTFVIDDSVFVRPPPVVPGKPHPYTPYFPPVQAGGTLDKLLIGGHYYSDKSPVPAVLTAGLYRGWLALGGPTVAERPDLVIRFLTAATSGGAYLFAVCCVFRLGRRLGLTGGTVALFGCGFAFATVAPAYTRHVNNHVLLLGAAAGVTMLMAELDAARRLGAWRLAAAGSLAGLGYTIDLGAGPPLLAGTGAFVLARTGRLLPTVGFALAALPFVATHHALNHAIGGTIGPANAVPEYLAWPGSPFTAETMTGGAFKHPPGWFVAYALDLLFGQKGIVSTSFPTWLAVGGSVRLWLWFRPRRAAIAYCLGWTGGVWLLYAATSSNYAGACASIRWFVPFLPPLFWVVGTVLAEEPKFRRDFAWLTLAGLPVAGVLWWEGTWMNRPIPYIWECAGVAGAGWAVLRWRDDSRRRRVALSPRELVP